MQNVESMTAYEIENVEQRMGSVVTSILGAQEKLMAEAKSSTSKEHVARVLGYIKVYKELMAGVEKMQHLHGETVGKEVAWVVPE